MRPSRARIAGARSILIATTALVSTVLWTAFAGSNWDPTFSFPNDPNLRYGGFGQPGWVKFTIQIANPTTVIFQNSNTYAFHYDFAVAELPGYAGMTPQQYDAVSLFASGQQLILGAVLVPPPAAGIDVIPEYGIQLVRQDAYTVQETLDILTLVASRISAAPNVQAYYMPSLEQADVAATHATTLAAGGFPVAGPERWIDGDGCYSHGWALGTLRFVTAAGIDAAFLAGDLTADDILLTDGVPAEIPQLAGVITENPATPNSHVALLAQTFDVPFVYLGTEDRRQDARGLVGRRVALRARDEGGLCQVRLVDAEEAIDAGTAAEILALKEPPPLQIDAVETYGAYSAPVAPLVPADIRYFGGKAAHSGLLRQSIPANSPLSTAFSFDLWNAFLDQQLPGGQTLRQEIAGVLAPFSYPPDAAALDAALDDLRDTIKDDTVFTPALEAAVLATLQDPQYGFDPMQKLRFRSSTNVEDSEQFTGAGLYDSFSGCLADDLDANSFGPSLCDPDQNDERGVFRAIRKVFASFFNLNATIERLRHGIVEDDVGMALLVHHSFPDPIELANGVATLTWGPGSARSAYVVLQPGANSVTNPDPGQIPEEVDVWISSFSGSIYPTVLKGSNLLVLGETVLTYPDEYVALTELLLDAADRYATVTGLADFTVEFEFKKTAPGDTLVVTQMRRLPISSDVPSQTPFLLNQPTDYCVLEGETGGSIFSYHRLKSRWDVRTVSDWLTPDRLQTGFFDDVAVDLIDGCATVSQAGPLSGRPDFTHTYASATSTDSWSRTQLQHPQDISLRAYPVTEATSPRDGPLVFLGDFGWGADYTDHACLDITVDYDSPLPDYDYMGPTTTLTDYATLCRCPTPLPTDLPRTRVLGNGGITITTEFFWPKPVDVAAGYTAPLIRFERTTIAGLTSAPIVLTEAAAQTYKPGHHNFSEEFMFEPRRDGGVDPGLLDQLAAAGIRVIHAYDEPGGGTSIDLYDDTAWQFHCLDCQGPDGDGDGRCLYADTFDCDDGNPQAWLRPGPTVELRFAGNPSIVWQAPALPGSTSVRYDTLRSAAADRFDLATCIETGGIDTTSPATGQPASGDVWYYLVRAVNDCPNGHGPIGQTSTGSPRTPPGTCP